MTEQEFISSCKLYKLEEDSEYKNMFRVPGTCVYTYYSEGDMIISWDLEYSIHREASLERLTSLVDLFEE